MHKGASMVHTRSLCTSIAFVSAITNARVCKNQRVLFSPWRQVLDDFQHDQAAAQRHLKRPEIMANIQKLVKAGIVQLG